MFKMITALFAGLIIAIPGALAQKDQSSDDEHAAHHPPDAQGAEREQHDPAQHLRANLKAMRDMMARLRSTEDAAERKRLLDAHMLALQEQLRVLRAAAAGPDHSGEGQPKEDAGSDTKKERSMMKDGMMGGGMMKMHKKGEQRLDALQGLLEQLIEHEAAEGAQRSH